MAAILSTSFAVAVTDWAATWPLASVTGVQVGHLCVAESELAQVTRVGPGTTVTVRRGVEGTVAAAHATSTAVAVYRSADVPTATVPLGSAAVPLRQATVTLTDAQITTLPTIPVLLLAAPGANRVILPSVVVLRLGLSSGVGYSNIYTANAGLILRVGQWVPSVTIKNFTTGSVTNLTDFLTSSSPAPYMVLPLAFDTSTVGYTNQWTTTAAEWENRSMTIDIANGPNGNLTGGHAANTLTVSIGYGILDVTTGVWV